MKLADITPAPWNTRTAITDESVRSLAASMEADGLIQPISVCDNADGDGYICYDGNRRLAAARLLGWDEIAANYTDISPADAKVRTVTANSQREDDDPLLAAGVIAALLDEGLDAGEIAAKLGKSASWVSRRRKMIGASDALREAANKVTVELLERVAVLPEEVQQTVCREIENRAKYMGVVGLGDMKYSIEREMRDLDHAPFDIADCAKCASRTGAEADLFGECDCGKLGKCLFPKCYEAKRKAWEKAEIARLVGDAEVVRVKYAWEMSSIDGAKDKRDRKHPCAYVFADGDRIEVKWGESAKARKAREEEEKSARDAEREAEAAESRHAQEVTAALEELCKSDGDGEWKPGVVALVESLFVKNAPRKAVELVTRQFLEWLDGWHGGGEWGEIVEAFPALLAAAGVSADDAEWFRNWAATDE